MKIAIVGGHFSPALSVIERLKDTDEIFYIGRKTNFEGDKVISLEYREITSLGIKFFPISAARMQRKFTRYTLISLSKMPIGFFQSIIVLLKTKPDVVLGFGGYLSISVCLAAKVLNIPIVIHEQTLGAGFANKFVSKFAKYVLISWESSRKYFPKEKTILTGLPLTNEVIETRKKIVRKKTLQTVYVTGGSAGSHFINELIFSNLKTLLKNFYLVHQTGNSKFKDYEKGLNQKKLLPKKLGNRYKVKDLFTPKNSAMEMKKADFVIGRSGINTVSELIYFEKPAILIPLPFGQKNEQLTNANFLKDLGLAEVLEQEYLSNEKFIKTVKTMKNNLTNYKLKKQVLTENAVEKIIKILKDVSNKKKT